VYGSIANRAAQRLAFTFTITHDTLYDFEYFDRFSLEWAIHDQ
jgi:hypothetical protein